MIYQADGPWKLERKIGVDAFGQARWVVLPNSIRSTSVEADQLIEEELARTGIAWIRVRL